MLYELGNSISNLTVYYGAGNQTFFTQVGNTGTYVEAFGMTDTLTSAGGKFTLTDSTGKRHTFSTTFTHTENGPQSKMIDPMDAAGNDWHVYATNANGDPTEVRVTNAAGTDTESWLYSYISGGVNDGKLLSINQRIKTASTWTTIRTMTYSYYDGATTGTGGSAGDVLSIVIADASGNVISDDYYRYYTDDVSGGFAHGVKYALSEGSYRRLIQANSGNAFTSLTDAQIAPYADSYYSYNSARQVITKTVQGAGCSACSGGQGTYTYTYATSGNAAGSNSWASKTTETMPDGNQNITYFNSNGQTMLTVYRDATTGSMYGTFNAYDTAGRVILTASPSAVALPGSLATIEAYSDLLHSVSGNYQYLNDAAGKIMLTDYYTSTTAAATTAGGVAGYEQDEKVEKGETGTAILISSEDYFARTDGVSTIYPVADSTQYRNADGTGAETTSYAYTWFSGSLQQQTQTTTLAAVTTAENGSGTANGTTDVYNQLGQLIWSKDASGFITYNAYDPITGGLLKTINDVKTTATADFDASTLPSGWTTPSGGGLELITTYSVDLLGRQTGMTDPNGNVTVTVYNDANHETRTYVGWNAATKTTTGPIQVRRNDLANSYGETLTYSWSGTGTNALPVDANGNPTGTESLTSSYATIQSLTRDIVNASGQVIYRDLYTNLSGISYSQSSQTLGTVGTNYLRTTYGYDWRGRQARVTAPDGTITQTVYDGLGRVISVYKGTNNTGWTQTDPTGGGATGNNMVQVAADAYDNGAVGDSNLTASTQYSGSAGYETDYAYDWRDRMVATRGADKVATQYIMDNLGEQTETDIYADANSNFTIDAGEPIGKSTVAYDELGRAYQSTEYQNARVLDTGSLTSRGTTATVTLANHSFTTGQNVTIAGASNALYNGTFTITVTNQNTFTYTLSSSLTGTASGSRIIVQADKRLTSNTWYDARGNLAKTQNASGLINKWFYDGADRLFRDATSADPTETASGTYFDAMALAGDQVIEENDYWLDKGGRTRIVTNWKRDGLLSSGVTGVPTTTNFDHSSIAYWYDAADRLVASADYGRDGGEYQAVAADAMVWNTSGYTYKDANSDGIPDVIAGAQDASPGLDRYTSPSDTVYDWISTGYGYDAAGRLQFTTDNANRKAETLYDLAGRTKATIANYVDGTASETETDTDQTTQYVYDAQGRLSQQIALNPQGSGHGVQSQTTQYVYGSDVDRSWVTATLYPDSTATVSADLSGKGTVSGSDATFTTYDRLGRQATTTDQRGVVHTFTYDAAGRFSTDSIGTGTLPTGVDGTVRSIAYTYDDQSRTATVSSKDVSGNVLNQVAYTYDAWGHVTRDAEAHDGAVTGTTPAVNYLYTDGSGTTTTAKTVHLSKVLYPTNNGTTVGTFVYGYETTNIGAALDRIGMITDGSSTQLVVYTWLGINTRINTIAHPQISGGLTMNDGAMAGYYSGTDRYYRLSKPQWQTTNGSTNFDQDYIVYDRMGNILSDNNNPSAAAGVSNWDQAYTYDGLNRLSGYSRGTYSGGVITGQKFAQSWTLDALGNWRAYSQTNNDTTLLPGASNASFTQTRTANAANEIGTVTGGSYASSGYDAAGNQTTGPKGDDPTTQLGYVYDGWNRQIGVDANHDGDLYDAGDVKYSYDGTGRRITKFIDSTNDGTNNAGSTEEYYQNEANQVLEMRIGTVASGVKTVNGNPRERTLWDITYIDAPAMIELDTNTDGTRDNRLWPTWDQSHNVTAYLTDAGKIVQHMVYTPFGGQIILNGASNYAGTGADPDGSEWTVDTNGSDFLYGGSGFQGLRYDPESGNWYARARYESPAQGDWAQRDIGQIYRDGSNLTTIERNNPLINVDPSGMQSLNHNPCWQPSDFSPTDKVIYASDLDNAPGYTRSALNGLTATFLSPFTPSMDLHGPGGQLANAIQGSPEFSALRMAAGTQLRLLAENWSQKNHNGSTTLGFRWSGSTGFGGFYLGAELGSCNFSAFSPIALSASSNGCCIHITANATIDWKVTDRFNWIEKYGWWDPTAHNTEVDFSTSQSFSWHTPVRK